MWAQPGSCGLEGQRPRRIRLQGARLEVVTERRVRAALDGSAILPAIHALKMTPRVSGMFI